MGKLLKASLWIAIGMLAGRALGFCREIAISRFYGASETSDIIILILTIPDLLLNLLVGGSLGAVLVPEFKRLNERAFSLFFYVTLGMFIVFSIATFFLQHYAYFLASLMAPGLTEGAISIASIYLSYSIWLLPFSVAAGVSMAYLHSKDKFVTASFGTFYFNTFVIVGILLSAYSQEKLKTIAVFVLIGGVFRWGTQLFSIELFKQKIISIKKVLDYQIFKQYGKAVIGGVGLFLMPFIARATGSLYGEGSLSLLNYVVKLIEFPLGVCISALSIALLPTLSQHFMESNRVKYQNTFSSVLYMGVSLTLIASLMLYVFGEKYIVLIYGSGLELYQVEEAAAMLKVGAALVVVQGVVSILTAACHSQRQVDLPFKANLIGVTMFLLLNISFSRDWPIESIFYLLVASYFLVAAILVIGLIKIDSMGVFSNFKVSDYVPLILISFLFVFAGTGASLFFVSPVKLSIFSFLLGIGMLATLYFCNRQSFVSMLKKT